MLIRTVLLACGLGLGGTSQSLAQGTSGSLAVPNSEVHRITARNGRTYTLYVQLPESYTASDSASYPVLYLTDAEAELLGMFTGLNYFLRLTENTRDVILVGVADGGIAEHFRNRRLDYTPTVSPPASNPSGGAAEFLSFLRDRAIPFIEHRYRTSPADRGIWGHSLGGLFAAYALLDSPGTFHRYLLSSPTLSYDDQLLVKRAAAYTGMHDGRPVRIYSAYGAEEPASHVQAGNAFFSALGAAGDPDLRIETDLVPEANHATVMPIAFVRGMRAAYGQRPIGAMLDSVIVAHGIDEAKR